MLEFLKARQVRLWGEHQPEHYLENMLLLALYKDQNGVGYDKLENMMEQALPAPHHTVATTPTCCVSTSTSGPSSMSSPGPSRSGAPPRPTSRVRARLPTRPSSGSTPGTARNQVASRSAPRTSSGRTRPAPRLGGFSRCGTGLGHLLGGQRAAAQVSFLDLENYIADHPAQ